MPHPQPLQQPEPSGSYQRKRLSTSSSKASSSSRARYRRGEGEKWADVVDMSDGDGMEWNTPGPPRFRGINMFIHSSSSTKWWMRHQKHQQHQEHRQHQRKYMHISRPPHPPKLSTISPITTFSTSATSPPSQAARSARSGRSRSPDERRCQRHTTTLSPLPLLALPLLLLPPALASPTLPRAISASSAAQMSPTNHMHMTVVLAICVPLVCLLSLWILIYFLRRRWRARQAPSRMFSTSADAQAYGAGQMNSISHRLRVDHYLRLRWPQKFSWSRLRGRKDLVTPYHLPPVREEREMDRDGEEEGSGSTGDSEELESRGGTQTLSASQTHSQSQTTQSQSQSHTRSRTQTRSQPHTAHSHSFPPPAGSTYSSSYVTTFLSPYPSSPPEQITFDPALASRPPQPPPVPLQQPFQPGMGTGEESPSQLVPATVDLERYSPIFVQPGSFAAQQRDRERDRLRDRERDKEGPKRKLSAASGLARLASRLSRAGKRTSEADGENEKGKGLGLGRGKGKGKKGGHITPYELPPLGIGPSNANNGVRGGESGSPILPSPGAGASSHESPSSPYYPVDAKSPVLLGASGREREAVVSRHNTYPGPGPMGVPTPSLQKPRRAKTLAKDSEGRYGPASGMANDHPMPKGLENGFGNGYAYAYPTADGNAGVGAGAGAGAGGGKEMRSPVSAPARTSGAFILGAPPPATPSAAAAPLSGGTGGPNSAFHRSGPHDEPSPAYVPSSGGGGYSSRPRDSKHASASGWPVFPNSASSGSAAGVLGGGGAGYGEGPSPIYSPLTGSSGHAAGAGFADSTGSGGSGRDPSSAQRESGRGGEKRQSSAGAFILGGSPVNGTVGKAHSPADAFGSSTSTPAGTLLRTGSINLPQSAGGTLILNTLPKLPPPALAPPSSQQHQQQHQNGPTMGHSQRPSLPRLDTGQPYCSPPPAGPPQQQQHTTPTPYAGYTPYSGYTTEDVKHPPPSTSADVGPSRPSRRSRTLDTSANPAEKGSPAAGDANVAPAGVGAGGQAVAGSSSTRRPRGSRARRTKGEESARERRGRPKTPEPPPPYAPAPGGT